MFSAKHYYRAVYRKVLDEEPALTLVRGRGAWDCRRTPKCDTGSADACAVRQLAWGVLVHRLVAGVVLLLLGAVLISGAVWMRADEPVYCPADALIVDGKTYGRDPDQGCKFVDEDGNILSNQ